MNNLSKVHLYLYHFREVTKTSTEPREEWPAIELSAQVNTVKKWTEKYISPQNENGIFSFVTYGEADLIVFCDPKSEKKCLELWEGIFSSQPGYVKDMGSKTPLGYHKLITLNDKIKDEFWKLLREARSSKKGFTLTFIPKKNDFNKNNSSTNSNEFLCIETPGTHRTLLLCEGLNPKKPLETIIDIRSLGTQTCTIKCCSVSNHTFGFNEIDINGNAILNASEADLKSPETAATFVARITVSTGHDGEFLNFIEKFIEFFNEKNIQQGFQPCYWVYGRTDYAIYLENVSYSLANKVFWTIRGQKCVSNVSTSVIVNAVEALKLKPEPEPEPELPSEEPEKKPLESIYHNRLVCGGDDCSPLQETIVNIVEQFYFLLEQEKIISSLSDNEALPSNPEESLKDKDGKLIDPLDIVRLVPGERSGASVGINSTRKIPIVSIRYRSLLPKSGNNYIEEQKLKVTQLVSHELIEFFWVDSFIIEDIYDLWEYAFKRNSVLKNTDEKERNFLSSLRDDVTQKIIDRIANYVSVASDFHFAMKDKGNIVDEAPVRFEALKNAQERTFESESMEEKTFHVQILSKILGGAFCYLLTTSPHAHPKSAFIEILKICHQLELLCSPLSKPEIIETASNVLRFYSDTVGINNSNNDGWKLHYIVPNIIRSIWDTSARKVSKLYKALEGDIPTINNSYSVNQYNNNEKPFCIKTGPFEIDIKHPYVIVNSQFNYQIKPFELNESDYFIGLLIVSSVFVKRQNEYTQSQIIDLIAIIGYCFLNSSNSEINKYDRTFLVLILGFILDELFCENKQEKMIRHQFWGWEPNKKTFKLERFIGKDKEKEIFSPGGELLICINVPDVKKPLSYPDIKNICIDSITNSISKYATWGDALLSSLSTEIDYKLLLTLSMDAIFWKNLNEQLIKEKHLIEESQIVTLNLSPGWIDGGESNQPEFSPERIRFDTVEHAMEIFSPGQHLLDIQQTIKNIDPNCKLICEITEGELHCDDEKIIRNLVNQLRVKQFALDDLFGKQTNDGNTRILTKSLPEINMVKVDFKAVHSHIMKRKYDKKVISNSSWKKVLSTLAGHIGLLTEDHNEYVHYFVIEGFGEEFCDACINAEKKDIEEMECKAEIASGKITLKKWMDCAFLRVLEEEVNECFDFKESGCPQILVQGPNTNLVYNSWV